MSTLTRWGIVWRPTRWLVLLIMLFVYRGWWCWWCMVLVMVLIAVLWLGPDIAREMINFPLNNTYRTNASSIRHSPLHSFHSGREEYRGDHWVIWRSSVRSLSFDVIIDLSQPDAFFPSCAIPVKGSKSWRIENLHWDNWYVYMKREETEE